MVGGLPVVGGGYLWWVGLPVVGGATCGGWGYYIVCCIIFVVQIMDVKIMGGSPNH